MAINPSNRYPNNVDPASTEYPYGKARDVTEAGDDTGTPFQEDLINDLFGFQQALLVESNTTPSGTPDTATNSQQLNAVKDVTSKPVGAEFETILALITGVSLNRGSNFDFASYIANGNRKVKTTYHNLTSKAGSAEYIIKTLVQAVADGDVIDGTGAPNYFGVNHALADEVHCAVRVTKNKNVFIDWLNPSQENDSSLEIQKYLDAGFNVNLPEGVFFGGTRLNMRSGLILSGAGAPRFDDTVSGEWDNSGTLLKFGINIDNCQDFEIYGFSVDDTTGDGVSGGGVRLGRGKIKNVNTKTTAHSFLFNLFCPDPDGALNPSNNVVGGVDVEMCEHWGGTNAFVSKHHNITFRKCVSHGTSSQSFVAISDNINGASSYNRATFTTFDRCISDSSANDFRCYTRDVFSADPSNNVNTNNVKPCSNTSFIGCGSKNTSQYPVLLGDFDGGSYASLRVENIIIDDHADSIANFGFIRCERAKNVKIRGSQFRAGNNVAVNDSLCENIIIDDSNTIDAACTGDEVSPFVINNNSSSVNFSFWRPSLLWRFQNTATTSITTFNTICYGKPIIFWIDDNFTSIVLNGLVYTGKGTRITAVNTTGVWRILSCDVDICQGVQFVPFNSAGIDFSFNARRNKTLYTTMTGTLENVTSSISNVFDGAELFLRFDSGASSRSITNFDSTFVFNSTVPSSVSANSSLLIRFYKHDSKLIEISRVEYLTPS